MSARASSWRRGAPPAGGGARQSAAGVSAALPALVGRRVCAGTADGRVLEGALASVPAGVPAGARVVLTAVSVVGARGAKGGEGVKGDVTIDVSDLTYVQPAAEQGGAFATDADISSGGGAGRELKRFDDFNEMPANGAKYQGKDADTFGEMAANGGGMRTERWDQFVENKRKFGVETTFDELEYTTKIDKSDPEYAKRAAEAAKFAAEIEGNFSANTHVREERGQDIGAGDGDEEDRYSGVRRKPITRSDGGAAPTRKFEADKPAAPFAVSKDPAAVPPTNQGKNVPAPAAAPSTPGAASTPAIKSKLSYAAAAGASPQSAQAAAPGGKGPRPSGPASPPERKTSGNVNVNHSGVKDGRSGSGRGARASPVGSPPGGQKPALYFGQYTDGKQGQQQSPPGRESGAGNQRSSPMRRAGVPPSADPKTATIGAYSLEAGPPGVDRSDKRAWATQQKLMKTMGQPRGQVTEDFRKFSSDYAMGRSSSQSMRDSSAPVPDTNGTVGTGAASADRSAAVEGAELPCAQKSSGSEEGSTSGQGTAVAGSKSANAQQKESAADGSKPGAGVRDVADPGTTEAVRVNELKQKEASEMASPAESSASALNAQEGTPDAAPESTEKTSSGDSSTAADADSAKPKPKFKLNPNAQAFTWKPSAQSSSPSSSPVSNSVHSNAHVDDDASTRIPSSPGPGTPHDVGMYPQDLNVMNHGGMPGVMPPPNAGVGGHMPFVQGQYPPHGGMPVGYGIQGMPQHMPHMGAGMMHPMSGPPMYHHHPGMQRVPYPVAHAQYPPSVGPRGGYMQPPGPVVSGAPAMAYGPQFGQPGPPGYPMSQPVGQPVSSVMHSGAPMHAGHMYQGGPRNSYGGPSHHHNPGGRNGGHRRRHGNNGNGGNGHHHDASKSNMQGGYNGHVGSNHSTVSSNGSYVGGGNVGGGNGQRYGPPGGADGHGRER